jgi:predicted RNA-binding protein with PIN domain
MGKAKIIFPEAQPRRIVERMAVVRILVDGYSLLHEWLDLAPKQSRFSAPAREELVRMLERYSDASSTPVTVVFDGSSPRGPQNDASSTKHVEILYSRSGQTADQIIERVAHRMKPYGEVLAVSDDHAERDTVIAMGGVVASCRTFIGMVEAALGDLKQDLARYNSREKRRYKQS